MDRIRVSEALDTGSIPVGDAKYLTAFHNILKAFNAQAFTLSVFSCNITSHHKTSQYRGNINSNLSKKPKIVYRCDNFPCSNKRVITPFLIAVGSRII